MKTTLFFVAWLAVACGDNGSDRTVYFAQGDTTTAATFWDFPFPSDLRLDAAGAPDLTGFPNPRNVPILTSLLSLVPERRDWPAMSTAYFRFTAPVPAHDLDVVFARGPAYLIDIDPASPERGELRPVVVKTLSKDSYLASDVVAVAPRPGIVLRPHTTYAYVLAKDFAPGFSRPSAFDALAQGGGDSAAKPVYAPLWPALEMAGVAKDDVLVATVFTTGDEIARTRARSEAIRAAYHPTLTNVQLVGGDTYVNFCRLSAEITMPQFQRGTQPFDSEGRFDLDANDVPAKQGEMTIPVVITLPKLAMPATGWPLYQFFHGSGGVSSGLVDLGHSPTPDDMPEPGKGPGYVVALHGIAAASGAMPINPERLDGASDYAYLNINNLAAFPYTFSQGVFEQRLLLDALLALRVPDSVLAGCTGISSPGGEQFFDPQKVVAGGQSMGGMYTNLVSSVEERYGAIVPTGAGGFWNLMILESEIIPGARSLLGTALGVDDAELTFVHPAMNVIALAWEIAEPIGAMARIARYPLPGLAVRNVYEPVGKDDVYFPTTVYDAAALAYGNQQAGMQVWTSMQDALGVDSLRGVLSYPVTANRDGKTRVVVQFEGDGIIDPHYIYRQLDAVKHQYGCFLETYLRDGVPTVPAPNLLGHPCL
ncbi:MAG TPA: hypothetical protein VLB44_26090 [Kofleriaceae bacterium]|nr:hypothetical protein [Kofleriaceae bacterium]